MKKRRKATDPFRSAKPPSIIPSYIKTTKDKIQYLENEVKALRSYNSGKDRDNQTLNLTLRDERDARQKEQKLHNDNMAKAQIEITRQKNLVQEKVDELRWFKSLIDRWMSKR